MTQIWAAKSFSLVRRGYTSSGGGAIWQPTDLSNNVWQRPTGTEYVTWESLVGTTAAAQQAASPTTPTLLTATFVKAITGNKILSLPPGVFVAEQGWNNYRPGDTANNYMMAFGEGFATGVRGIVGSGSKCTPGVGGAETILRMASPMPSLPSGSTPTGTLMIFNKVVSPYLGGLSVYGVQTRGDNVFHSGVVFSTCTGSPVIEGVYLKNISPGYGNAPPGETFGINIYQTPNALIRDSEIDGRDLAGTRSCASPIGWNNCGYTGTGNTPSPNAYANTPDFTLVQRVYAHHGLTGMLTFWDTKHVKTEDYYTFSWPTGTGGMSGTGINHEQSDGRIRHIRPRMFMNSTKSNGPVVGSYGHPPDDMTKQANTSSSTFTLNCGFSDAGADFEIWYPEWDNTLGSSGVICMAAYNGYPLGYALVTAPRVYIKDGSGNDVSLARFDHPNSGWQTKDPLTTYIWIH